MCIWDVYLGALRIAVKVNATFLEKKPAWDLRQILVALHNVLHKSASAVAVQIMRHFLTPTPKPRSSYFQISRFIYCIVSLTIEHWT